MMGYCLRLVYSSISRRTNKNKSSDGEKLKYIQLILC
jgi:hypothetical protein